MATNFIKGAALRILISGINILIMMLHYVRQKFFIEPKIPKKSQDNGETELKKGFSIICIYNNEQKLSQYLIQSLSKQNMPYELLTIDNTKGDFPSAAHILNETARKAKHEYIIFVHQDVALESNFWLDKALIEIKPLNRFGAAGVAGRSKFGIAASVNHGNPPRFAGLFRLFMPVKVQTLDGCLMIVATKLFKKIPFDQTTNAGFFFYIEDYCLDLISHGYNIYVLPCWIYHESTGPGNPHLYEKAMNNLISKHRLAVKTIFTTLGKWKTS